MRVNVSCGCRLSKSLEDVVWKNSVLKYREVDLNKLVRGIWDGQSERFLFSYYYFAIYKFVSYVLFSADLKYFA
jgi:hypothetical protein